jgi:hypothetical protein
MKKEDRNTKGEYGEERGRMMRREATIRIWRSRRRKTRRKMNST